MKEKRYTKTARYNISILMILITGLLIVLACNKEQKIIAIHNLFQEEDIGDDELLFIKMNTIPTEIILYFGDNNWIFKNFKYNYRFISRMELKSAHNKTNTLSDYCDKFKYDKVRSKIIAQAKYHNACLLIFVELKKIKPNNIYKIQFSVIDLEDNCIVYKIIPTITINRNLKEKLVIRNTDDYKVAWHKIITDLTEIIKKTEK